MQVQPNFKPFVPSEALDALIQAQPYLKSLVPTVTPDTSKDTNVVQITLLHPLPTSKVNTPKLSQTVIKDQAFQRAKRKLSKNHPELFVSRTNVLAHDIREQILKAYPEFENYAVLRFLRSIFATNVYLETIVKNQVKVRYNLDMSTTSFISTEQRKTAANYLLNQLNNYRTPKKRAKLTAKQRHSFFDSLTSLDQRFDVERYTHDHEEFTRFLQEEMKGKEENGIYKLTENMWPDNF